MGDTDEEIKAFVGDLNELVERHDLCVAWSPAGLYVSRADEYEQLVVLLSETADEPAPYQVPGEDGS